jgi:hypothetical protein
VKADRIIWPVDKGATKRRTRKKLKVRDHVATETVGRAPDRSHEEELGFHFHFNLKDNGTFTEMLIYYAVFSTVVRRQDVKLGTGGLKNKNI